MAALNDLQPWEKRNDYYSTIKLGKDVATQNKLLTKATKDMVATQLATVSEVIASQDRMREGIGNLEYKLDEISEGLYGLKAAFEFGISEVVWQIEQNRTVSIGFEF